MRLGPTGRAAIALLVAATAWSVAGPSSSRAANAPSADYYQVASTPPGGRVVFPGWTSTTDLARADDGSFLVQLERRDPTTNVLSIAIARLRPDTSLDVGFGAGGATPGIVPIDLTEFNRAGQPTHPLVPLADGRYIVGSRMFLADGSVDLGFGFEGFITLQAGGFMGGIYESVIRTSTNNVVVLQAGPPASCGLFRVGPNGIVDQTVFATVVCSSLIALPLPDGDTLLLSYGPGATTFALFFVRPDGTMDTTRGQGTGVVTTQIQPFDTVMAAQMAPSGQEIVIGLGSILGSPVMALRLDGSLDPTFGSQPANLTLFPGFLVGLHVDDQGRILASMSERFVTTSGQTFNLLRLTANGVPDSSFNPLSTDRPWLSAFEMGVKSPGTAQGHLALSDGRLIERFAGGVDASGARFDASIVVLTPATPGTGPTPTTPNIPTNGANATQRAQRGQRITVP